jgi:hypothetical protein
MIAKARTAFPALRFDVADLTSFTTTEKYDAIFSNAVLHWVKNAAAAARCFSSALVPGGRFVVEFGGLHNVATVCEAAGSPHPWYFPGIPEYGAILEGAGIELRQAWLFPRPTKMDDPVSGLRDWIQMFGAHWLDLVPEAEREPGSPASKHPRGPSSSATATGHRLLASPPHGGGLIDQARAWLAATKSVMCSGAGISAGKWCPHISRRWWSLAQFPPDPRPQKRSPKIHGSSGVV